MTSSLVEALEKAGELLLTAVKTEIKETIRTQEEEKKAKTQLKDRITADYYVATGDDMPPNLETYLIGRISHGWGTYQKHGKDLRCAYRFAIDELEKIQNPFVVSGASIALNQVMIDYVVKKKEELKEILKKLS